MISLNSHSLSLKIQFCRQITRDHSCTRFVKVFANHLYEFQTISTAPACLTDLGNEVAFTPFLSLSKTQLIMQTINRSTASAVTRNVRSRLSTVVVHASEHPVRVGINGKSIVCIISIQSCAQCLWRLCFSNRLT